MGVRKTIIFEGVDSNDEPELASWHPALLCSIQSFSGTHWWSPTVNALVQRADCDLRFMI